MRGRAPLLSLAAALRSWRGMVIQVFRGLSLVFSALILGAAFVSLVAATLADIPRRAGTEAGISARRRAA